MSDNLTEGEFCEYLHVRHAKMDVHSSGNNSSNEDCAGAGTSRKEKEVEVPGKFIKRWTQLWVVLKFDISPTNSFIAYCKKEEDWLMNKKDVVKLYLSTNFTVTPAPPEYSRKFSKKVLQVGFGSYRVDIAFSSMTKMDQWCKVLQSLAERHHVDLVRCPEHPEREGEYVIQVCSSSFKTWSITCSIPKYGWEWHLKHIRRIHWHKTVHKLEVEAGRSSETGEGHFYFTGRHSSRLFDTMKQMMSMHSMVTSPMASPQVAKRDGDTLSGTTRLQATSSNGRVAPVRRGYGGPGYPSGMESDEDWTGGTGGTGGTGEDWTSTSSDSGFITYIQKSKRFAHGFSPSPCTSPPPPLPPKSKLPTPPPPKDYEYMNLMQTRMEQDNQYITINRQELDAMRETSSIPSNYHRPRSAQGTTTTTTTTTIEADVDQTSLFTDDEYCKMVPQQPIRSTRTLPKLPPIPPPHRKPTGGINPSLSMTDVRAQ